MEGLHNDFCDFYGLIWIDLLVDRYFPLVQTRQDNQIHADVTTNILVTLSDDNYVTNV